MMLENVLGIIWFDPQYGAKKSGFGGKSLFFTLYKIQFLSLFPQK